MRSVQLNISDTIFDKVMFFLNNIPKKNIEIISDSDKKENIQRIDEDVSYMTNSSVNCIEDWQDESEDEIWK